MRRSFRQIRIELKAHWRNYLFQSLLATITLFVILLFLSLENAVVTASIGATAFIVFTMPSSITAQPRNVIGGQLIGLFFGSACAFIPHAHWLSSIFVYSLAVGLSILAMVILDMEHPPASGTALGFAITGVSWEVGTALAGSVFILSIAHKLLEKQLRDLV